MSTVQSPENGRPKKPLALIAGPTASGKSDLAVRLALALGERGQLACVVNADSAQVYADLRVLSARPTQEEMRGIPHKLFGAWDGSQACSAADWAKVAKEVLEESWRQDAIPILVGGTGLYIRTLLDGIAPIPEIESTIREDVRALPAEDAYAALRTEDPERAAKLNAGDTQRIARALEVVRSTGRTLIEWQKKREGGIGAQITLAPLVLMPDREALYKRCDARFGQMLLDGAIEEVAALLARELDPDLPVMRAIGVREIGEYLASRLTLADTAINAQRATRQYAKRQFTWLRHQLPLEWPRVAPKNVDIARHFDILLRN